MPILPPNLPHPPAHTHDSRAAFPPLHPRATPGHLAAALGGDTALARARVTLSRLVDRRTRVGLLLCRVDANRVRRYQAMPSSVHALPHFECQSCHRDSPLSGALAGTSSGALKASAQDLERAAQTALQALKALGYQGTSMDFAVRGVCADCASGSRGAHGVPA